MTTTQSTQFSMQTQTQRSGFNPELFTVPTGTYASNASFGSGVPSSESYNAITVADQSVASVRQQGTSVDFDIRVVLSTTAGDDPGFTGTDEIRLRCNVPSQNAGDYVKKLPASDHTYTQPLFADVELIDTATGGAPAGYTTAGLLQARYLHGGELAIVLLDPAGGPPPTTAALTVANLTPIFAAATDQIALRVRGSYRAYGH